MARYVCIHGHFYQPPRENPWLEAIELQDSAYPYHDWNERITAECYTPNAFSRILDSQKRIERIVNNYSRISFNIGATLLSWLQEHAPSTYAAIQAADRESRRLFSGHGSALAQVYNHVIMPLANRRDKVTQVVWGMRDFQNRFGRKPEGMWLAETAVDLETLDILSALGIRFTILSPYQAARVRRIGQPDWRDVTGGHIDPTTAYMQMLPSGRSIYLFFYDGPIARAVAFEKLLARGEDLADRLLGGFNESRPWAQLVHIATDGESYGHHHPHGDMALAFALRQIEASSTVRLTNYGEFLEKYPPQFEVDILENTAWSCAHGVGRWQSDCGCNSGRAGWNQQWREPLRHALDWLRDELAPPCEALALTLLEDFWAARNDYISVILDRSLESRERFLATHSARDLTPEEEVTVWKLLELQRHVLLMYTSCGWFFDEISGIETVQILQYAGRAIQLGQELLGGSYEEGFLSRLDRARSNIPEYGNGRAVYEKFVGSAMIDGERVGAHYAVSSLFEEHHARENVNCFSIQQHEFRRLDAGKTRLVVGQIEVTSEITQESGTYSVAAVHFGDHNVTAAVCPFVSKDEHDRLASELAAVFAHGDFTGVIRLMDNGFAKAAYSLRSLFRDEQRRVLNGVLQVCRTEVEETYRRIYEQNLPTMRFLASLGVPLPHALQTTAELILNEDLGLAFDRDELDVDVARQLMQDAATWRVALDSAGLAYRFKKFLDRAVARLAESPLQRERMDTLEAAVTLALQMPFEVDLWGAQNVHWQLSQYTLPGRLVRATEGDGEARTWVGRFAALGERLGMQPR